MFVHKRGIQVVEVVLTALDANLRRILSPGNPRGFNRKVIGLRRKRRT